MLVNSEQNTVQGGYLECSFVTPTGVTAANLTLSQVQLYPSDSSTGSFTIALYDASGLNVVSSQSQSFTPSSTPTTCSLAVSLTPGTEYRMRVSTNVSGAQSRFLCAGAAVTPTTSSDAFWLGFQRLEVDYSVLQGNARRARLNPRFSSRSAMSYVEVFTSATQLRIEMYNWSYYMGGNADVAQVFVDGYPYATLQPTLGQSTSFQACTLPTTLNEPWHVRVGDGLQLIAYTTYDEVRGTFIVAVYAPAGAYFEASSVAAKKIAIRGDSKLAGAYASIPPATSESELLRQHGFDISNLAIVGASYIQDIGSTISVAAATPDSYLANNYNPDVVIEGRGRIDFTMGILTPANVATLKGYCADATKNVNPRAMTLIATYSHETSENPVSGVAWNTQRQNEAALVNSRPNSSALLDLGGLWTSAQTGYQYTDGVHPNDFGYSRIARAIESAIVPQAFDYPFKPFDLSPVCWFESDVLVTGSANWTAVTSAGTNPPSVTFTGSPTYACQILLAVTVTGPLGTALFNASLDGGKTWPYMGLTTASTVALTAWGITIHFPSATYTSDNFYQCTNIPSGWTDLMASGNNWTFNGAVLWVPPVTATPPTSIAPAFVRGVNPSYGFLQGLNVPQPYTVVVCAKLDATTAYQAIVGQYSTSNCPLLFTNLTTSIALVFNGYILAAPVATNAMHVYAMTVNGNSSALWIDGAQSATGTLGAGNLTEQGLFWDSHYGYYATGDVYAYGVLGSAITSDQAYCLAARMMAKYGVAPV
jgi:hypothetical protein